MWSPKEKPSVLWLLPSCQRGYLLMALQGRGWNVADLAFPSPTHPHSWQGPDPSPDGAQLVCLAWLVLPGRPASPSLKLLGTAEQGPRSWPKQVFLWRMGLALQPHVAAKAWQGEAADTKCCRRRGAPVTSPSGRQLGGAGLGRDLA